MKNPEKAFLWIVDILRKQHVTFGPAQYNDEHWQLLLMTLSYEGQDIDISGAYDGKVFDQQSETWVAIKDDFMTASMKTAYSIEVPVMNKEALIAYKKMLARDVDNIDIAQIS